MSDPTTGEWTADTVEGIAVPAFIECRDGYQEVANAHNAAVAAAVEAIAWLNEFVVEPEYFPAEGDRYWWQEKRAALAKIGGK